MQGLIKVHCSDNSSITIPAVVRGPLALHRTIDQTRGGFLGAVGDAWVITHVDSGVAISSERESLAAARWQMRELLKLDWSTLKWKINLEKRCGQIIEGMNKRQLWEINKLANARED